MEDSTLNLLSLAAFKIKEMLAVGDFTDEHRANFERALQRIEAGLAKATGEAA